MQTGNSIKNLPLLISVLLSIAIHTGALYSRSVYTPAEPNLQTGQTVIQLTLQPSPAITASASELHQSMNTTPAEPQPQHDPLPQPEPVENSNQETATSREQIASPLENKGINASASIRSGTMPTYPRLSQLRGEEGTVFLSVEVLAEGTAGHVEILESSGCSRLDHAAVEAAQTADYTPAQKQGHSIDSTIDLSFTFRLTDD